MPEMKTKFSRATPSSGAPTAPARGRRSPRNPGTNARPGRRRSPSCRASARGCSREALLAEQLEASADDLGHLEGTTLDLVEADRVDQVLGADEAHQLPQVHLGNQDPSVASEDAAQVGGEWVQVPEVHVRHRFARRLQLAHRLRDRAVGAAPADDQQLALGRPEDLERGYFPDDAGDLARAHADHLLVVGGRVAHVAGQVLLLEPADAVLEVGRAGDDPRAREGLLVAPVGEEAARLGAEGDGHRGKRGRVRKEPRLGLEIHARAAGGGDGDRAAEGRAERGADAGDLVLGLEGVDAVLLPARELVQHVARGRDRIAAEEEGPARLLRRAHEAEGGRGERPGPFSVAVVSSLTWAWKSW